MARHVALCVVVVGMALVAWLTFRPDDAPNALPSANALSADREPVVQPQTVSPPAEVAVTSPEPEASNGVVPPRVDATVPEISWETKAADFVAARRGTTDVGLKTVVMGLSQLLGGTDPFAKGDPFATAAPTVEQLTKDSNINPLGLTLDAAATKQLEELLRDHAQQIRSMKRDQYLATQVSLGMAVERGDYVEKPNGSDPDGVWKRTVTNTMAAFSNPKDHNIAEVPGRDLSHNRIVVLRPEQYPDYMRAVNDLRIKQAEWQIAVRSFFLPSRR